MKLWKRAAAAAICFVLTGAGCAFAAEKSEAEIFFEKQGVFKEQRDLQADATRAFFVQALYYALEGEVEAPNKPEETAFTDVSPQSEYAPYIVWATEKGIIAGDGTGKFSPEDPVTREQAATMLLKAYKAQGKGPVGGWAILLKYKDADEISQWAFSGVMFCRIKNTFDDRQEKEGYFYPQKALNHAECMDILYRFHGEDK